MKFLALVLTLSIMAPSAYAMESIGKVLAVKGDVRAVRMDGSLRAKLSLSSAVYENDKIQTGDSSKVQVVFNDKSLFTVGENAEVILDKYAYDPTTGDGTSIIEVTKGIFKFLTGAIAKKDREKVKVNTPFATIGVRGSGGIIHVSPEGQTTLNMTECCLNIGARGSASAPVELKEINTFSRVSKSGDVTQPKPAPVTMLLQLNNAISLEGVEKTEDAVVPKKEVEKKSSAKKSKIALATLVKKQEKQATPNEKNAPAEGSLTSQFGSAAAVVENTTETQQEARTDDSVSIEKFGSTLNGNFKTTNNGATVRQGTFKSVVEAATNKIIFERSTATGEVIDRAAFDAPNKGTANVVNNARFGSMFVYRGQHDNFIYASSLFNGLTDNNYTFVAGNNSEITAANQNVSGQRQFFNFIPDSEKGLNQFANFNLAAGTPNPVAGSYGQGVSAHTGGGLVVDYTNDNSQFLGGNVKLNGASGSSFKFMVGKMATSGTNSFEAGSTAFSFNNKNGIVTTQSGSVESTDIYGEVDAGNAVVDAYALSINGDITESVHIVDAGIQQPTGSDLNTVDAGQSLKGYSSGYITDKNGDTQRIGNTDHTDVVISRNDHSAGGVSLSSQLNYKAVDANGVVSTDTTKDLSVKFGSTGEQAYISHNIYGAEEYQSNAGYNVGSSYGSFDGAANVEAALISSNFVDIPEVTGLVETCQDCEHLTWGVWAGTIGVDSVSKLTGQIVPYVVGDTDKMKSWTNLYSGGSGVTTANYKGILVGATSDGTSVQNGIGSYTAAVDFQNRDVKFNGDFADYHFEGTATDVATTGSKGFAEVNLDTLQQGGNLVDVGDATISGAFYGDAAENMGGNFNFNDTVNTVTGAGIFAGKKQ